MRRPQPMPFLVAATMLTIVSAGCGKSRDAAQLPGDLWRMPAGAETRWSSFENPTAGKGMAGLENQGPRGMHSTPSNPARRRSSSTSGTAAAW